MKFFQIFFFITIALLMASCVNGSNNGNATGQDSALVTATGNPSSLAISKILDPLVEKYPNYLENSIARESLEKELAEVLKQNVGKPCDILEGLPLNFNQVVPNGANEAVAEFHASNFPYSDKWDVSITVYCTMNKEEALKLSKGEYTLNGHIQDWQPDVSAYNLSLGKFLIKDAHATPFTY